MLCARRGAEADHGRPLGARGLRARHHRGRLPGPETQGARQHRPHDRGQAQTGAYVTRLIELTSILRVFLLLRWIINSNGKKIHTKKIKEEK